MQIELVNECGSFVIGGSNPTAQLLETAGLGPPAKELTKVVFLGQPGFTQTGSRDLERTITISFDFFGNQHDVEALYKIIFRPVDIYITSGNIKRKINGLCTNATDIEYIIYHEWNKAVFQFLCASPYFNDFEYTQVIMNRENQLPNFYLESDSESGYYVVMNDESNPPIATRRLDDLTVTNRGDTNVYPKLYLTNVQKSDGAITSEAKGISIINNTIGKAVSFMSGFSLGVDNTIMVDLEQRKIFLQNGLSTENITLKMSDDTVLGDFVLIPGSNNLSFNSSNPSDSNLSLMLEFNNNYCSAVI